MMYKRRATVLYPSRVKPTIIVIVIKGTEWVGWRNKKFILNYALVLQRAISIAFIIIMFIDCAPGIFNKSWSINFEFYFPSQFKVHSNNCLNPGRGDVDKTITVETI